MLTLKKMYRLDSQGWCLFAWRLVYASLHWTDMGNTFLVKWNNQLTHRSAFVTTGQRSCLRKRAGPIGGRLHLICWLLIGYFRVPQVRAEELQSASSTHLPATPIVVLFFSSQFLFGLCRKWQRRLFQLNNTSLVVRCAWRCYETRRRSPVDTATAWTASKATGTGPSRRASTAARSAARCSTSDRCWAGTRFSGRWWKSSNGLNFRLQRLNTRPSRRRWNAACAQWGEAKRLNRVSCARSRTARLTLKSTKTASGGRRATSWFRPRSRCDRSCARSTRSPCGCTVAPTSSACVPSVSKRDTRATTQSLLLMREQRNRWEFLFIYSH